MKRGPPTEQLVMKRAVKVGAETPMEATHILRRPLCVLGYEPVPRPSTKNCRRLSMNACDSSEVRWSVCRWRGGHTPLRRERSLCCPRRWAKARSTKARAIGWRCSELVTAQRMLGVPGCRRQSDRWIGRSEAAGYRLRSRQSALFQAIGQPVQANSHGKGPGLRIADRTAGQSTGKPCKLFLRRGLIAPNGGDDRAGVHGLRAAHVVGIEAAG